MASSHLIWKLRSGGRFRCRSILIFYTGNGDSFMLVFDGGSSFYTLPGCIVNSFSGSESCIVMTFIIVVDCYDDRLQSSEAEK